MADGLFGPSPWEVQQAQQQALGQGAAAYAQMSPMERAAAGMYQAGGMLTGVAANALGGKNVPMQNAQRTEQIMGAEGTDLASSQGLFAKADEFRKAGDLRTAAALTMKAQEMKRQEQSAALAQQKQDESERFRRDQLTQAAELKQAQLAQAAEAARMRSEDTRLGIDARRDAAREANQMKLMLAQMTAEIAKMKVGGGGEKPLTADQRLKWERKKGEDVGVLMSVENELNSMITSAKTLKEHPGLSGASGARGYLYSLPGGDAAKAEALLEEFKASVSGAGLEKVRMGGGIGAMTVQEWPLVEKMIANIDPKKLGAKGTQDAIDKVITKMEGMAEVAKKKYKAIHGESAPGEMDGETAPANTGRRIKVDANGNIIK